MKLTAGIQQVNSDPTSMQFPAPSNGHYENIEIWITTSGDRPLAVYLGTIGREDDITLADSSSLDWEPNILRNGVLLVTQEFQSWGSADRYSVYRHHFGGERIKVKRGELLTVRVESDTAPTNVNLFISADFVPYKGSTMAITVMQNTTAPEAMNYGKNASIFAPVNLSNCQVNVAWVLNDVNEYGGILKMRKFATQNLITHTLTAHMGDVVDLGDDTEGTRHGGDLLGRAVIDATTGLSGKTTIPVGELRKGERIAWDFQELVGSAVDIFQIYVTLTGTVSNRHWTKAGRFIQSTYVVDLTEGGGLI